MGVMEEGILAFLCVAGAVSLITWFFVWLLRPERPGKARIVLPARGDGDEVENTLQWYAWLRRSGLFQGEAVIFDAGLTPKGREVALRLALRWGWVSVCPRGTLEEWLEQ